MQSIEIDEYCDLSQPAWPDRFGRLAASDCKQADALEGQMPIRVLSLYHVDNRDDLAKAWIVALVESITLQRVGRARIDEPCDIWVDDIKKVLRRYFK